MAEKLANIDVSTLTGEKVAALLASPEVVAQLDLSVILTLRELEFIRTGFRDIQADNYMAFSNSIPKKGDPHYWTLALPLEQARLLK